MIQLVFLQYVLALCAGMSGLTVMVLQYRMRAASVIRDLLAYNALCFLTVLVYGIGTYSFLFGFRVPAWYAEYSVPVFLALVVFRLVFIVRLTMGLVGSAVRGRRLTVVFVVSVALVYAVAYAYYASSADQDSRNLYMIIRLALKDLFVVFPVFCCSVYLLANRRGIHSSVYGLWVALTVILIVLILMFVAFFAVRPDLCRRYVDMPMIVFFLSNVAYVAFYALSFNFEGTEPANGAGEASSFEDLSRSFGISKREYEIIVLVSDGHSYAKIGELLFISPNTVRNHVSNAYRKLGIENKIQLYKILHTTT